MKEDELIGSYLAEDIINNSSGEVLFENKTLNKNRSLQLRKLIQFVQQNPMSTLNPKKTIYSTIALPLKIHKIVKGWGVARLGAQKKYGEFQGGNQFLVFEPLSYLLTDGLKKLVNL